VKLKMEDGSRYAPKDSDEVRCDAHNLVTTWGALDAIQQLAIAEGLDTTDDLPCICAPRGTEMP
jgi:hypothetical protein